MNLRPNSLESLRSYGSKAPDSQLIQALSCHRESLTELNIDLKSISSLFLLTWCTNLVSLSLAAYGNEKPNSGASLEVVVWLKECKNLRVLACDSCFSALAFMEVLTESNIQLTSLKYRGCALNGCERFCQTLAGQINLEILWLRGSVCEYPGWSRQAVDDLVESLSQLVNLTELRLEGVSDSFTNQNIIQLASILPKLEVWSTNGYNLTDAIWGEVATLRSMRRLDLCGLTNFMSDGIFDFLEKLGVGNKGLVLSVMRARTAIELSWVEQEWIQETIAKTLEGRFEYALQ